MIETLETLPPVLYGAFFVAVTVLLALLCYGLARFLFVPRSDSDTRDLAGAVIFRVSALHGLILALVFAQELLNANAVETAVEREAALVANVFFDLERYDAAATEPLRRELAAYVAEVLEREWDALGRREGLTAEAWARWQTVYPAILDLEPQSVRQEALKPIMLDAVREISALRRARENAADAEVHPLFWAAALGGIVVVSVGFFVYPPSRVNLALLGIYGAYTGLVMFVIAAVANPFGTPARVEPTSLGHLYVGELKRLHESAPPG